MPCEDLEKKWELIRARYKFDGEYGPCYWNDLERLTLWYGKLSGWPPQTIINALARVLGIETARTEKACSGYWQKKFRSRPESERDIGALLRGKKEDVELVQDIEKLLKSRGNQFLSGLDLEAEQKRLWEEWEEWMKDAEKDYKDAGCLKD